jgi:hypothetical protein
VGRWRWDATVFTKNRDRLLEAEVAKDFLVLVVEQARGQRWASEEHFTVDGSLLEAWASAKSFQPKNKSGSAGERCPVRTHTLSFVLNNLRRSDLRQITSFAASREHQGCTKNRP